jgi:GT2 family glycosyltransferase
MAKGNVTIVIPTYFGNQMLENCVKSIFDNCTNPRIFVYKNDIGWLQACNEAIQTLNTDIILLNDDTIVISDIVEAMGKAAYSDPKIGVVGGKALAPNFKIINYGIYVGTDGNTAHKHFGKERNSVNQEYQKAVEGSCMYIKRDLINDIGVFDEGFGMGYREEVDYAFRAREAGWKVVSTPKAEYIHLVNQTHSKVGVTNDRYDYFMSKWGTKLKLGQI